MTIIECPLCEAKAELTGKRWKCTTCGGFGRDTELRSKYREVVAKLEAARRGVHDLEQTLAQSPSTWERSAALVEARSDVFNLECTEVIMRSLLTAARR